MIKEENVRITVTIPKTLDNVLESMIDTFSIPGERLTRTKIVNDALTFFIKDFGERLNEFINNPGGDKNAKEN